MTRRLRTPRLLALSLVLASPAAARGQTDSVVAAPPTADSGRTIGPGQVLAGAVIGGYVGFGLTHLVIGDRRRAGQLLKYELIESGVAGVGLAMAFSGTSEPLGLALLAGGLGALAVTRVWSIVDVFRSSARHDAAVAARRAGTQPSRGAELGLVPLSVGERAGLALVVRF